MTERLVLHPDALDGKIVTRAVEVLQRGGIIVYPTDTIYGLGADPFNPEAVARLQRAKQRFERKPILLIAHSIDAVRTVVKGLSRDALQLAEKFWPGPLTMVLPARENVPMEITQGSGTIGVRIPSNPFCLRLTEIYGGPITSTSANITGRPTPEEVDGIVRMLGESVELYLDAGRVASTTPSTIVDLSTVPPRVLRQGVIAVTQVQEFIPTIVNEG